MEGDVANGVGVGGVVLEKGVGPKVPQLHGSVGGSGSDARSVGVERDNATELIPAGVVGVARDGGVAVAAGHVPDADGLVVAAGDGEARIGREASAARSEPSWRGRSESTGTSWKSWKEGPKSSRSCRRTR